jgi:hypothetical protein
MLHLVPLRRGARPQVREAGVRGHARGADAAHRAAAARAHPAPQGGAVQVELSLTMLESAWFQPLNLSSDLLVSSL